MTAPEFNRWWADYSLRFPDTAAWLAKVPSSANLLAIWRDALDRTNLADALEVNRLLTRGELERWKTSSGYHEREETPAMIRKMAWELARNRGDHQEHRTYERPKDQPPSKFPIGILFRQFVDANERCARDPTLDKAAEHQRLKEAFLEKYSAKAKDHANYSSSFDAYNAS